MPQEKNHLFLIFLTSQFSSIPFVFQLTSVKMKCGLSPPKKLNKKKKMFISPCRLVFKDASGTLDKGARFSPLYRQDSSKLSDEDMFKLLADFRKYARTSSYSSNKTIKQNTTTFIHTRVFSRQAGEDGQTPGAPGQPGRDH